MHTHCQQWSTFIHSHNTYIICCGASCISEAFEAVACINIKHHRGNCEREREREPFAAAAAAATSKSFPISQNFRGFYFPQNAISILKGIDVTTHNTPQYRPDIWHVRSPGSPVQSHRGHSVLSSGGGHTIVQLHELAVPFLLFILVP